MNLKKITFLVAVFVLCIANECSAQTKQGLVYKNGFAVGLGSVGLPNAPTIGIGYYFGGNNCMSTYFGVRPYETTRNSFGVAADDSWSTSIGAGVANYISLARAALNNQVFFEQGIDWNQHFGKGLFNNTPIDSSFSVGYRVGFQYRLNPRVYFSLATPAVAYSQTKYKSTNLPINLVDTKQYTWSVFSAATMYIAFLF